MKWTPAPPPAKDQESLEKRLERLERMLGLLGEERREFKVKGKSDAEFQYHLDLNEKEAAKGNDWSADVKHFEWNSENHPNVWVPKEHQILIEKSVKEAEEQVARAMMDAERATIAQRRARVDAQVEARVAREHSRRVEPRKEERRALELERRALEQRMRELERQLERLNEQMERVEEHEEKLEDLQLLEELEVESEDDLPEPRLKEKRVEN